MRSNEQTHDFLDDGYALARGYAPSLRLDLQHRLLQQLLGYTLHPNITSKLPLSPKPKVADVGTGTAQWLIDLGHELLTAELDGFDISNHQFPDKAWLGSQISLTELDITQPIPHNLEGIDDVVHVQLFLCVVTKDNLTAILADLYKLLKPGGFLQWVEYDPTSFRVVSPDPALKQTANEQHVQIIRGPQGVATTWPSELPSHLASLGFEEVVANAYPLPPELYAPFMQCHLCAAEEVSFTAMKNDSQQAQGPSFRKLLGEVYKECQMGVTMAESPLVVIGRKAQVQHG
ncbi:MAG: hypothetical protein Q9228_000466 [Teloschistes exilis]